MRDQTIFKSLILGFVLNLVFPFTYNNGLFTKPFLTIGNPYFILLYAGLISIFLPAVSVKDVATGGKVPIDESKEIPKTIIRSVLEIFIGIILFLIVPLFLGAILTLKLGMSVKPMSVLILMYFAGIIALLKKTYWSKLYEKE